MPQQKVFVIRRSKSGLGMFAVQSIPKGTRIIEYTGPRISNEEVDKRRGKYFFGVNKRWTIDGSPRTNIARYINHSCIPNAEAIISGQRIWIWSKRNIRSGEEITYHYGDEYFDDIIKELGCRCKKCAPASRTERKTRALK
ncbi:MAG TPA: SET domain-containing protein [Pyrinomonadaceae bacterium]|nr:SET domain-containing protein [Pyrinomonadaceae bacterium]